MRKGMNVKFTVGEVKDGLQQIEIKMDIPSSSTEAKGEIIDVTVAKQTGSSIDLEPKVRTIHGDLKSNSSVAVEVPDQEMLNIKLKFESDISATNPSSSPAEDIGPSSILSQSSLGPTASLSPKDLEKKTTSLLDDFFSDGLLYKASQCIEELRSPSYHTAIVRESILLGFGKNPPMIGSVFNLLEHLVKKKVLASDDVIKSFVQCVLWFDGDNVFDWGGDLKGFGWLIGKLVSVGVLNFKVLKWILVEFDVNYSRSTVFDTVMVRFRWDDPVLKSQSRDVAACRELCEYRLRADFLGPHDH